MAAKLEDGVSMRAPDLARARGTAPPGTAAEKRATNADTIPPMPLKELLSAGGANLHVFSTDSELIATVQRAGGEHYPVFAVSDWIELELAIQTGQCGIALLDVDLLGAGFAARIAELEPYSHRLVVLVAADRAMAQALMSLLSDRKIHRLLIKPPALGITRLLVESAVNRCLQLRELAKGVGDTELPAASAKSRPRKHMPAWVFVTAGAALLAGVGTIVGVSSWWRAETPATIAAPAAAAAGATRALPSVDEPPSVTSPPRFDELLARAEQAFGAGRLAAPSGDNALDYYLVILAADPAEPAAREQLARVIDALFAQAEEALLADAYDTAAAALAQVRRADPSSGRLTFLEAQLERARAAAVAARPPPAVEAPSAARPAASPASGELASLVTIARARIARGQLLAPTGDSAREYLARAVRLAPDDASVAAVRAELAGALVAAARTTLESGAIDAAAGLTAEAARLGADSDALARLNTELATARTARTAQRHAEWFALAESRLRNGALVAPEDDSALRYLEQLESEPGEITGLAAAWEEWRVAVAADVARAVAVHDWDGAQATLVVLQRAPRGDTVAAPLRAQLEFGRLQEQYLAVAVPASELMLVERAPVVYPPDAQRREIEGWVDIEFVVDTAGRPRDLIVIAAEPTGRFDEAALAALRESRYRPFERDGRVFERRLRLRTRFTLE